MKVLYIDDDLDDLQLFQEAIEETNSSIICLTANSGQEALRLLKNGESPDLIFLDVVMPKMDGITCLANIRQIERFSKTKIILMSVSAYIINREKIIRLEASFIRKPNNYRDLVSMLANYFNQPADHLSISGPLEV